LNHNILSFERRNSGAFEHSWQLFRNLQNKKFKTRYFSHWWNSKVNEIFLDETKKEIDWKKIENEPGIFHLQSHTWENQNLLEKISKNPTSKIIYNLHAIIPYFYMNEKEKKLFLEKKLPEKKYLEIIENKLNKREKLQLDAIKRADYLFTISKNHKKVLEIMKSEKPIYVFENVVDSDLENENFLKLTKEKALELKEKLNSENIILYCGNFYKKKGSESIIKSFDEIKKHYLDSKLILLGDDKKIENSSNIQDIISIPWINKNSLEAKINFYKHYLAADILIQPMITEELYSKSVIDAMYLELPTITCKSPYSIGSSKNEKEIFNSYIEFKENKNKTKKIIKKANKKVKKENTWENYIEKMNKIVIK
jgi:glycosyltransferase involved in cell wall biosynthesis